MPPIASDSFWWSQLPHVTLQITLAIQVDLGGECVGIQSGHRDFYPSDPRLRMSNPGSQPGVHHLLNAWLVGVEQWPGLHVFGYKAAAHPGDVFPVSQSRQCHVLVRRLLLTCGCQWVRCMHLAFPELEGPLLGPAVQKHKSRAMTCLPYLCFIAREKDTEVGQGLSCTTEPRETYDLGSPGLGRGRDG